MSAHILIAQTHGKGGRRALTPQEERDVAIRVAAGEKKCAVAKDVGVHRNTVPNILKRWPDVKAPADQHAAQGTATTTDAAASQSSTEEE